MQIIGIKVKEGFPSVIKNLQPGGGIHLATMRSQKRRTSGRGRKITRTKVCCHPFIRRQQTSHFQKA